MAHRFDYARFYYWRVQFIEPIDPDDDHYVILHGDEGEIAGPMTMAHATVWIQAFHTPVSGPIAPPWYRS